MKRAAVLVFAMLAAIGCQAPTQYGGPIVVDAEGFQQRWQTLCGLHRAPSDASNACAPRPAPSESAPRSTVAVVPPPDPPALEIVADAPSASDTSRPAD